MLSTLGTSEPHCNNQGSITSSQPLSTSQLPSTQTVDVLRTTSTAENACNQSLSPHSTCYETHLTSPCSSRPDHRVSSAKSHEAFGGNLSILESYDAGHSNQTTDVLSTHLDLDRSIVMSTSTPLDTEESTVSRMVPLSSACIVNMEQQFVSQHTSLTHGQFIAFNVI